MHPSRPTRRRVAAISAATLAAALVPMIGTATTATAVGPTELFFSEYVEGSGFNKAVEIFNGTGSTVDLAAGGYNLQIYFNGNSTPGQTINLSGAVAHEDAFVLGNNNSENDPAVLAADQLSSGVNFNGDDAVVLRRGTQVIDVIGTIGADPGTEWGSGAASTADNTLRRKATVTTGDSDGTDAFAPSVEWDGLAQNTFDGLGVHAVQVGEPADDAPALVATSPATGARNVPVAADLTATFSEPVDAAAGAFGLYCAASGDVQVAVSGGPTTFTLDPATDLVPGDRCFLTVEADAVTDQDVLDPPDSMATDVTVSFSTLASGNACELPYQEIPAIQGSGATATTTNTVTTQGVVVGDHEGPSPALRGFYLQDLEGDDNPVTSDGIFVFNGNDDDVAVGDVVRVTGRASDYQDQTQLSASTLVACGTGSVEPTTVTLPLAPGQTLEPFEGMLVRLPQTMHVTEHYLLGRFGQVTLSAGSRLQQPTNVVEPGPAAVELQAENDARRIILDDSSQAQNVDPIVFARDGKPLSATNTLRGGDTATGIVGVMTYTWGGASASPNAYRVRPVGAMAGRVEFEATNARPTGTPAVGGRLQVAGMNVLNYFNTIDGCSGGVGGASMDCRGADTEFEFKRQADKTVAAITKMGAEVVGVVEIENDGYGADSALADLVDRLNAEQGAGTWAYVDVDERTGQVNALGTDAIKVGAIYQPAKVRPVGDTAVLNTPSFVSGGDNAERNRPALAQAFVEKATGGMFVAVVNHLKSKGSACGLQETETGQGNCNLVRVNAAQELASWLASDPTATDDPDTLILGDLNSYAMEDPIGVLEDAGYTNLVRKLSGEDAYSYVFDGQWGYLDHALGSASLEGQVTGVEEWHVNADEPTVLDYNTNFKPKAQFTSLYAPDEFRNSDHDPVVVGLDLTPGKSGGTGRH